MKNTIYILALAGTFAFFSAGGASADVIPEPAPGTVSTDRVAPGTSVTFSGSGILPAEPVSVAVDLTNNPTAVPGAGFSSPIILAQVVDTRTTTADPSGAFTTRFTLTEEGTYTLTATGLTSGHRVSASVAVDGALSADGSRSRSTPGGAEAHQGNLASTGADSAMLLWGAAGLLALGAGVTSLTVARRKNS